MIAVYISTGERAVAAVLAVLLGFGVFRDHRRHRPVTAPTPPPPAAVFPDPRRTLHLVPSHLAPADDEPHDGWPDLERWPPSCAEVRLARHIIAGADRYDDLVSVAGSTARALRILVRVRRENVAARLIDRAF